MRSGLCVFPRRCVTGAPTGDGLWQAVPARLMEGPSLAGGDRPRERPARHDDRQSPAASRRARVWWGQRRWLHTSSARWGTSCAPSLGPSRTKSLRFLRGAPMKRSFAAGLALALLAPIGASVGQTTFPGTNLGPVPDGPTGCYSTPQTQFRDVQFNVTGMTAPLTAVSVSTTFSPAHTWAGDLTFTLISPGGVVSFPVVGRIGATTAGGCGTSSVPTPSRMEPRAFGPSHRPRRSRPAPTAPTTSAALARRTRSPART